MSQSWGRVLRAVVTAAVLSLAVVGCTQADDTGARPTPSPPPTPSESVDAAQVAPHPWVDLECDELLGDVTAASYLGAGAEPRPTAVSAHAMGASISYLFSIRQVGGISCRWVPADASVSRGLPFEGLAIEVLPAAGEHWAEASYQFTSERHIRCIEDLCTADFLLSDNTWLAVQYSASGRSDPLAEVTTIASTAEAAIAAAPKAADAWAPPEGTISVEDVCEFPVTAQDISFALGLDTPLQSQVPHGGWSMAAGADVGAGAGLCWWAPESDEWAGYATVAWLPGGAWAYEEVGSLPAELVTFEPISLDGLGPRDSARLHCRDGDAAGHVPECVANVSVNGNWFQATSHGTQPQLLGVDAPPPQVDDRTAAAALAQAIVDAINVPG